jgi:5-methylthioadenosine/S-adenosylhomocysteine deaminase
MDFLSAIPSSGTSYWIDNCTIIQGAFLPVIDQGHVRVSAGRFTDVSSGPAPSGKGEKVLDGKGAILVPGFLNIHTHCALAVARGRFHGTTNMVEDFFFPLESKMTAEEMEDLSYPYMMAALASGTTLISDHFYHAAGTAKAADQLGIRAGIAECLMNLKGAHITKDPEQGFADFRKGFAWNERIFPVVGPHATDTCSPGFLQKLGALASEEGLSLHMHLSQTQAELDHCRKEHGKTPVKLASEAGLLGPRSILVHLVSASAEDLKLLHVAGSTAVACPSSQIIYENLLDPALLKSSGLNIALATDCAASNDTADLYAEMRLYALMCKDRGVEWSADELIAMVTTNPAAALGMADQVGSIEAGKYADFQCIARGPELAPFLFPKQDLVYSMSTRLIGGVLVAGKPVFANGQFLSVNAEKVLGEFSKKTSDLLRRAGLD